MDLSQFFSEISVYIFAFNEMLTVSLVQMAL